MQAKDKPKVRPDSPSRQMTAEAHATRGLVIQAAIQSILERGFYRASSNAIADRAGLTWGVIQYHFGNREKLMLAVLEEGSRRLTDDLNSAEITGATVNERLEQFFDVLAEYYTSPDYLAFIQVLLNLGQDPSTSEQTRETMIDLNERANPEFRRLLDQVLEGTGVGGDTAYSLVFHALRGLSISHVVLAANEPFVHSDTQRRFSGERRLLARSLSLLIQNPENLELAEENENTE